MAKERLKHAMRADDIESTNGKRTCVEQNQENTLTQDLNETTPQGSQHSRAKTGVTRLRSRAGRNSQEDPVIGIVERVELIDFMCHERADVQLCPKVNFITGQNGSGKSAILTGLIIALGGKATATNRAPSLKEFVREGRTRAIVRVELRNQGPEAYRPELFGSSIIIERQINSSGTATSQFKVKNGDNGDVVSKKKEDVVAITDHMAIQIDNPINILSQDAAREFLASTSADKMYHFFLKGTQLFQLREDLEVVRQAITRAEGSIDRKKEVLPEMKAEKKRWEQHYEDMRQARDLSVKMTSLSHQMAWAHVEEAEAEVNRAGEDIEVQERKLGKVDEKVDAENSAINEINKKVEELEEQARTKLAQMEPLQAERRVPLEDVESIKATLRSLKQTEEEINAEARSTRERVDSLKNDIETERERLVEKDSAGKERLKERIVELENEVVDREAEISALQEQQKSIETQTLELSKLRDQRRAESTKAQRLAEQAKTGLHELMQQTSDQLSAYGRGVREALAQIKKSSWRNMEPIGPLGKHIKLRNPKWSRIIETTLDKTLNAFLVGSHADRVSLDAIFRRCGCQSRIVVCSSELFDYAQGEPDSQYLTILRALEIDNEIVKRQLINLNRIEQIILVEQRALGDRIMVSNGGGFPHNVTACLSVDGYNVGARGGGLSTQAVKLVRPSNRLGEDISQAIEREKQTVATLSREIDVAQRALDEQTRESESMLREHKRATTAERQCRERINRAKSEIQQVRERLLSDEPAKIAALENELETFTDQLESIKTQFRDHMAQQKAKEHELQQAEAGVALVDKKIEAIRSQADLLRQASEKKASQCQKHSNNIEYWTSKRSTLEEKMDALRRQKDEAVSRVAEVEADARMVCPERVAVEYEPRRLDRLISECRARLEEIERSSSMSLADVAEKAQMHISAYARAKDELRGTIALVSKLKTAHQQRLQRWTHFRDSMAMRTKLHFIKNLHQRGYTGKLEFDHSQCTLLPKVKTDQDLVSERRTNGGDAAASPARSAAYQRKDTRSLSGGEKSFTTICLLLSLWETMNCPVRALDEFDVFMDAANRRIAMSMMIDSARSQKATQFILITPQDMSVKPDADITILRLQPPARSAAAT
ncbi:Structural maintenance of chromosomes protein 6 [Coemansia sp. RSA 1365]|nr:Structural maintenance of chromosomes protein 6 [Coemansia sp. RSA 1365]